MKSYRCEKDGSVRNSGNILEKEALSSRSVREPGKLCDTSEGTMCCVCVCVCSKVAFCGAHTHFARPVE